MCRPQKLWVAGERWHGIEATTLVLSKKSTLENHSNIYLKNEKLTWMYEILASIATLGSTPLPIAPGQRHANDHKD